MVEPIQPTSEVYAHEAKYMQALQRHSDDFDKLIEFVPEERKDVRDALKSVYNVEPDKLLNSDKLLQLKTQNEPLFREVSSYSAKFIEEILGLK